MTTLRSLAALALLAALSALAFPLAAFAQGAQPADLIVTGGRIYTVDATRPIAEAFAVRGGKFIFVGTARDAMRLKGPRTQLVDLHGAAAYPGFIDAHAHLLGLGMALESVDLVGVSSYEEVVARVVARAKSAKPGEWIFGHGWDQNRWTVKEFPSNDALTRAVPDHPVMLDRVDG